MRFPAIAIVAMIPLQLYSLDSYARNTNPCSDGRLKGWAKKSGYSQQDCIASSASTNTAPSVTITSPENGAQIEEGSVLSLVGTAHDTEDGDLSAAISWQPNSTALSVGNHAIIASVTDSGGLTSSTEITITITEKAPPPNNAPSLAITSPSDGTLVEEGVSFALSATASDTEDGDLSSAIVWEPAIAGSTVVLPVGKHVVIASVTDSGGLTAFQQVSITVTATTASTGIANLAWSVPTTRENGELLSPSELAGYEIYIAHEESNKDWIVAIADPLANKHIIEGLDIGTYHFAISVLDNNGLKSVLSEVVSTSIAASTGT